MKQYQIFTEDLNRDVIEEVLSRVLKDYTIQRITGAWHGMREDSLLITYLAKDIPEAYNKVHRAATLIKEANKQEAVLITESDLLARFI